MYCAFRDSTCQQIFEFNTKRVFKKRIKWILGPFVSFALIDALVVNYISSNPVDVFEKFSRNLEGHYLGYFLLGIFQFYILHYVVVKYRIKLEKWIFLSVLIMFCSLWLLKEDLNLFEDSLNIQMISFPTWIGYFTVAFLLGKHYDQLKPYLIKYKSLVMVGLFFSVMLIFASYQAGYTDVSSRRLDMFPLTIFMTLAILSIGSSVSNFKLVDYISNYSFGIFLLHWQVQRIIAPIIEANTTLSAITFIIVLFVTSIIISMLIVKLLSLVPGSSYVIGKLRSVPKVLKKESDLPVKNVG
ncbi:acyltransferase [Exiguobacterium sp. E.TIA.1]|uniref:acyltransferase family protein n=1 Tax=Exiguobacterium sp. E.TIA.1 TaxID=2751246 RepID=UPI001BE7FD83